jgi:hypothetical protein
VELAESLLVLTVPNVDEAVRAAGGKGVVVSVEANGVDGIDLLDTCIK